MGKLFEDALKRVDAAADRLDLDKNIYKILRKPKKTGYCICSCRNGRRLH